MYTIRFLGRRQAAQLLVLALLAWAPEALVAQSGDIRMLYFTSPNCPPCRQMEPLIEEFMRQQYPISKIDAQQPSAWVQEFQVTSTPTAILLIGDQIFRRHSGLLTDQELVDWFIAAKAVIETRGQVNQGLAVNQPSAQPSAQLSAQSNAWNAGGDGSSGARSTAGGAGTMLVGTREPSSAPEELALNATVRLRVEDAEGFSFATGTIIHADGNEALVLTCGHVFRESQGKGIITADWNWNTSKPVSFPGKLIVYDADRIDVALLSIRCGQAMPVARLAPRQENLYVEQPVFSLGCDHGEPPTIRHTQLKRSALYNNARKFEIYGRPVDGRSGGGLFTTDGKLVGVCNAAAVDYDEGIYSALDNVYEMIEKSNLIALFEEPSRPGAAGFEIAQQPFSQQRVNPLDDADTMLTLNPPETRPSGIGGVTLADSREQALATGRSLGPQSGSVAWEGAGPSVNPAIRNVGRDMRTSMVGHSSADQTASAADTSADVWEAIVILRHRQQPEMTRTYVIGEPNEQLLEYLGELRPAGDRESSPARLAQLRQEMPQLKPVRNPNSAWTRAQSPD